MSVRLYRFLQKSFCGRLRPVSRCECYGSLDIFMGLNPVNALWTQQGFISSAQGSCVSSKAKWLPDCFSVCRMRTLSPESWTSQGPCGVPSLSGVKGINVRNPSRHLCITMSQWCDESNAFLESQNTQRGTNTVAHMVWGQLIPRHKSRKTPQIRPLKRRLWLLLVFQLM